MNRSSTNFTIIAVLLVVVSISLAGLLSLLTPEVTEAIDESPVSVVQDEENGEEPAPPPQPEPVKGGLPGGNQDAVQEGRLPGHEEGEVNSDPDVFSYLINTGVELAEPDAPANIKTENNPGNQSPMQLCYYLEQDDELIYTSAMIQPGEHIDEDALSVKLPKGEYKVNAVISVYDESTMELKTTFHQEVTLTVNQKFLGIF